MSNESENRIDLTQFRLVTIGIELGLTQAALREWHTGMKRERLGEVIRAHEEVPKLIAELKKTYAREDELLDALRIIRDDLDDQPTGPNADLFEHMNKIRNFANDASL